MDNKLVAYDELKDILGTRTIAETVVHLKNLNIPFVHSRKPFTTLRAIETSMGIIHKSDITSNEEEYDIKL
jgi:hypothetical protein